MPAKPCNVKRHDGNNDPGYYDNENYRWFGRPVRANTPGLAKIMNVNATLLFIFAAIAYYSIPEFLYAAGILPFFPSIRLAYDLFFVAGMSVAFTLLFFYHKYRTELSKCGIGNKNRSRNNCKS